MTEPDPNDAWQEAPRPNSRSLAAWLVGINVAVFLGEILVRKYTRWPLTHWCALGVSGIRSGYLWQFLTYQFLHGGILHLVLNCWGLYVFGQGIEDRLGRFRFLKLYLFSGIVGGFVQVTCALLAPNLFGSAVVGASAGVFGLVAAYAALFPERQLTLLLFFVIPVTLRAKTMLLWGVILALGGALFPFDHVAHAAHLGGMLGGLLYLNLMRGKGPRA